MVPTGGGETCAGSGSGFTRQGKRDRFGTEMNWQSAQASASKFHFKNCKEVIKGVHEYLDKEWLLLYRGEKRK